jgi:hypothetical protein
MSNNNISKAPKPIQLRYFTIGIALIWSLFVFFALAWNYNTEKSGTHEAARIQARAAFENDLLYRRWNAGHGGLYAPVTESTQPNPYLEIPERDIVTPKGQKLTKINPAYMTRQVHELAKKTFGVKEHITSLKPIRPENKPDDWEIKALNAFEKGKDEVSSLEVIEGEKYMRLMRPLITEEGCLKCHAVQGYQVGDIRGGISVSVPLTPLIAIEQTSFFTFSIIDGLLWLIGIVGIWFGMHFLNRQIVHRLQAEEELREHEKLQGAMEMAGAVCHELNQPLQAISGYSELIMMSLDDGSPIYKNNKAIKQQIDRMAGITKKLMKITRYETVDYPEAKIIDINKASK